MDILFLTTSAIDLENRNSLYGGLLRYFVGRGHGLCIVTALERNKHVKTYLERAVSHETLHVRTPNIFQTSKIEKGLSYLLLESLYRKAIKKYWRDRHFDLILYNTPPPLYGDLVKWCKRSYPGSVSYMMLKDIFPQNAVDLEMMFPGGLAYRFFKRKELDSMEASDYIGCMSPANVDYVRQHYPFLDPATIELCPNTTYPTTLTDHPKKYVIRREFNLPADDPIFIYGGNLGKPQGIPHLLKCLKACRDKACHFLIIGKGTEFGVVRDFLASENLPNVRLISYLPPDKYDRLVTACDAGLIFLDNRFTIPNFPSRLLSYLRVGFPIIAVTDRVSDIGSIIEGGGFGKWCPADDVAAFAQAVDHFLSHRGELPMWGEKGHQYMLDHYTHEVAYNAIISHLPAS